MPSQHAQKKLNSSFALNSDESVVLQELSLNVHTLSLEKNPLLFLLSIESSSGSLASNTGKQITAELSKKSFSVKSTQLNFKNAIKNYYDTSI